MVTFARAQAYKDKPSPKCSKKSALSEQVMHNQWSLDNI